MGKIKKIVKSIKVDADKCNGCRACEVICSTYHATPKYSSVNPARARVHVMSQRLKNIWLPVFAGEYTPAECMGRNKYVIDGKEYSECVFCRAACPSRALFKEPDSGLPFRCDMCQDDPTISKPKCVEKCLNNVLIYEEREEEVDEEEIKVGDVEIGLSAIINEYGLEKVTDTVARMLASKRAESTDVHSKEA